MKIVVIGAGAAGLAAAKYAVEDGHDCEVLEQTESLGGTWVYTESCVDDDGSPVHTAMYTGLRTNLPKELMCYEGFSYPDEKQSYIYQDKVLAYIQDYAKEFDLEKYIQYHKRVTNVLPLDSRRWLIEITDVKSKKSETREYDAVMVCNGHFFEPFYPTIEGTERFHGSKCHSHEYRTNEPYAGQKVLIIGAGPSGTDISCLIAQRADKIFISYEKEIRSKLAENVFQRPNVKCFTEDGVIFSDGSVETVDSVLFCTGYNYSYPFLSKECGIFVEENHVQPLYKHIINIEHPTMCLIGLPFLVLPFPLFCLQARFFLSTLNDHFKLPPKAEMLQDLEKYNEERKSKGREKRHSHKLGSGDDQYNYFTDLATTANITNLPKVLSTFYDQVRCRCLNACFKIVDDENFIQIA